MAVNNKKKSTEGGTKKTTDQFDVTDILKNNTRFMIHGFLSIYRELSLKDLSELSGKPKNSLLDHLNIMVEGGILQISREERVRGKNTRKFYSLVIDADKKTKYIENTSAERNSFEHLSSTLETYVAFSQTKISLLSKWVQYLEKLQNKLKNGHINEVQQIFDEMKDKKEIFTSVSYYSLENAQAFRHKGFELYEELEEMANLEALDQTLDTTEIGSIVKKNRPYYASMTVIPIERVLNELKKKPKTTKKATKKE